MTSFISQITLCGISIEPRQVSQVGYKRKFLKDKLGWGSRFGKTIARKFHAVRSMPAVRTKFHTADFLQANHLIKICNKMAGGWWLNKTKLS
jgi:hypothetical protein